MVKIDLKDRKILANLDMNARLPASELAKLVQLSRQAVEYRIERLKREKVIFGAFAIFDSVTAGYNWYRVVIRLLNATQEQKNNFVNYLQHHPQVSWLGEAGGNWDLVVNFACEDNFQFNSLFEKMILGYGAIIRDYEILIYLEIHDFERSYILPTKKLRQELYHAMKRNNFFHLDNLDKQIIQHINTNATVSYVDLGQKLNVTSNTIRNRLQELKKQDILLGFRMFINPGAFGYKTHMLFLSITQLNLEQEKNLYYYLKSIPQVTFLVKHIGKWRIGMEIETQSEEDFQRIFVDIRGKFASMISDFEAFPLFKDHTLNYFPDGCLK
ncbi:Lrp/AsnC family transcriptional regulator [Candidatus Woesearchaeota archaeon]|nr:Lrp/AsnC family transcriptional regulator [Candidatus Woesearchaeota archaeon]